MPVDLLFHLGLAIASLSLVAWTRRMESAPVALLLLALGLAGAGATGALLAARLSGRGLFGALGFLAWAVFLHAPLALALFARPSPRRGHALAARSALAVVLALLLAGANAFWNEPTWLEVTRTRLSCAHLREPLKVVVVADLQTDRVGPFQERVLAAVARERPDLVLLPGDYVQLDGRRPGDLEQEREALRAAMVAAGWDPPLGVWAVPGNCDGPGWERIFAGVPGATTFVDSARVERGELVLTGLDLADSSDPHLRAPAAPGRFHIVLGHQPDFALGQVEADLLIAGHCHGGQVQLPFLGPILTLSRIPRAWAEGATELAGGRWLYVSRGVGMERGWAPRLRFLCRPELAVLELVPLAAAGP